MTRARILTIGMAIVAAGAAVLIPAGARAVAGSQFTATAPSSISVQCKSGASNGTLLSGFDLTTTFGGDNKSVVLTGTSISSTTFSSSPGATTVNAGTVFPCTGPASYSFLAKKQSSDGNTIQKSVTIAPVSCPSGDPCNTQT